MYCVLAELAAHCVSFEIVAILAELAKSNIVDDEADRPKSASIDVNLSDDSSSISFKLKESVTGTIAIDEPFLLALADVFSTDKDLLNLENEDVYKFVCNVLQV